MLLCRGVTMPGSETNCGQGYLGAGKTTLLNYILTAQHGKKIAVIMNGKLVVWVSLAIVTDHCTHSRVRGL